MKNRSLITVCTIFLLLLGVTTQVQAVSQFKEIYLVMDELDAKVLFRKEPHDKSSFSVKVGINSQETFLPASISVKGSFTRNFLKKSLMIKFNEGASWQGKIKVSLNSMVTDDSNLREWLAWDLITSLGMVSPSVEHYKVFINKEYIGLYLFVEWIDKTLFERFGMGTQGELFHPVDREFCGDMDIKHVDKTDDCWLKLFPSKLGFSPLEQLINDINNADVNQFDEFLEENFDVDSVINWFVVNTVTSNGDTYNKNYFLFLDNKTSKWSIIPWDYDLSFGRNADPVYKFPKNILNDNFQYYYPPNLGSPNALKTKFFKNPKLYALYQQRLRRVMGLDVAEQGLGAYAWFKPENFSELVAERKENVRTSVFNGLYDKTSKRAFDEHVESIQFYSLMRYHLLKQLVLTPTVFNTWHWQPYISYPVINNQGDGATIESSTATIHHPLLLSDIQAIDGDQRVVPIDGQYSRPLGVIKIVKRNKPLRLRMSVETEHKPASLPPQFHFQQCIQRDWYIDVLTDEAVLTTNITLDYIQESSIHHELGEKVRNEKLLQLWLSVDGRWGRLPAKINSYANTLYTAALTLYAGKVYHFVACQPQTMK